MKTDSFFFSLHRLSSEVVCIKCWLVPRQHLFRCWETGRNHREKHFSVVSGRLCCCIFSQTFPSLPSFPLHLTCAKRAGSSGNILKHQAFQIKIGGKNMLTGFFFFSNLYYLWKKFSPSQRGWFNGCACSWGCASEYLRNIYLLCTSESTAMPQWSIFLIA